MARSIIRPRWAAAALLFAPALAGAVTFTVNLTQDVPDADPGDGICSYSLFLDPEQVAVCTLRAAIMEGNATPLDQDVNVRLAPGATYVLNTPEPQPQGAAAGDLDIIRPMTIGIPEDALLATVDANQISRIFQFHPNADGSRLYGIKLIGGFESAPDGVAIRSSAKNTVFERLDVHDNTGGDEVGLPCAIYGVNTLFDSRVHHNGTNENLLNGVCDNEGPVTIARSTLDHNHHGIDIQNNNLWLHSSTIVKNTFTGVYLRNANATIFNSTISDNAFEAPDGSQISFVTVNQFMRNLILSGSIVDGSGPKKLACVIKGYDQSEATLQAAWNLYSDDSCVSDTPDPNSVPNATINLSELGDFGGLTPTQIPLEGSDAIDRAPEFVCDELGTDQRGLPRPTVITDVDASPCDIGAVELQPTPEDFIFSDSFENL